MVVQAGEEDPTAATVLGSATDIEGFVIEPEATDWRLISFRLQWGPAAERLLTALTCGMAAEGGLVLRFRSRF
ncbi:MAG: hypothetical protein H0W81_13100 [Chloroflexi bacterium]|nr:hypothetical protein [Chloroflexota bacterium]